MKINQILLGFGMFSTSVIISQPVITLADLTPPIGISYTITNTYYDDAGPSGANQYWDFSWLGSKASNAPHIESPTEVSGSANFPAATHVLINNEEDLYQYAEYANNSFQILGFATTSNNLLTIYNNPRKELHFPLTMNSNFTDNWDSILDMHNGIVTLENGTTSALVDGYGTLQTPVGTFTDVLRIKYTVESEITTLLNGTQYFRSNPIQVSYYFYKSGVALPLLTFTSISVGGQITVNANYLSDFDLGIHDINDLNSSLILYPNPAKSHIETKFTLKKITDMKVKLFSLEGQVVQEWIPDNTVIGENKIRLELNNITDGLYLMQFISSDGIITRKITIKQ